LAPLANRGSFIARTKDKQFHPRVEGSFNKIVRHGDHPANYWWEVTSKNGTRNFFGGTPVRGVVSNAVLKDDNGNIAYWGLVETRDLNNNFVHYVYDTARESQIYISQILYTGSGNEDGAYKVEFIRDWNLSETRRNDIDVNARLGFKIVSADLLRKVQISFKGQMIRSYELKYQEGAFYKTLLQSISELDDKGNVFYSHGFEYYDDVKAKSGYTPVGSNENWSRTSDDVKGEILNPIPGFTGEGSDLNTSKSNSVTGGLAVTVGFGEDFWSKIVFCN